jgi:glycosyltransferase involved in cell wall biosynthesis
VPYKGVDVLVRAMPRIHRETGARVRIVGDGPEAPRLKALARDLDAPVDFLGRVPQPDLARLYGEARVSVLPSVNTQEAFGIALLESMAAGTPVVASDLPGVREVASLAGATAPPGDPEGLAEAVVRAWRDPEAFGSPAEIRARVEARYAWPSIVERLEAVYADALSAVARPGGLPSESASTPPTRARRSLP